MNDKVLSTLEYDKILTMLSRYPASELGRAYAAALRPAAHIEDAETLLAQTDEAAHIYRRLGRSPIDAFPDVRELLERMHAALALGPGELLSVAACFRASRSARDALQQEEAPLLGGMASRLSSHRHVEEEIGRCIIGEEEIADNASPELSRIRRQLRLINERVRDKLNAMIKSSSMQKYLQEPIITMRSGRYALPVKAEHRAQVPGLVHDQSGSGATLFIEPAAVVELGNEQKRLLAEEKNEIDRILAALTAMAEPYADELHGSLVLLGTLDLIFARALMARDMAAVRPALNEQGEIHIRRARHPLLPGDAAVPIDLWLGKDFRTLIITGPNTGGKTVTLKTVGLLTLMAMSGMMVPADEGTRLSVFDAVYADIGDEQSIEQSLSTFSSHMSNTVRILRNADERSLVLLDELGAGTDPVEGAALAQAILETLYERRALTLATTHYSEIKAFALTHDGMQNASMEFDVERLCPTYRLMIGIPGKSNAFEISRRLGLEPGVIALAERYLERQDIAFESVIAEAEEARRAAREDREEARRLRYEAERLKTELERAKKRIEDEKSLLRDRAREEARATVRETRAKMEALIAELRRLKNVDPKQLERAIQHARDEMRASEERLHAETEAAIGGGEPPASVKEGDRVLLVRLNQEATVLKAAAGRSEALVQAGVVKLTVRLGDLRLLPPKKEKAAAGAKIALSAERGGALSLDLRGRLVDDAVIEVDRFIDDAAITGVSEFTIIHGKGTGALRSGIQSFLRTHPKVKAYRTGAYGEGDAGVTVVTLK
ncbi:MAG: endonuclease MutS2 [Clostridia bacterium]|nr:endonuclease MutS2 [Clostridia bacterium]